MAELKFDVEMARVQQALAPCRDMAVRRNAVLDALNLRSGESVLEVCGRRWSQPGEALRNMIFVDNPARLFGWPA